MGTTGASSIQSAFRSELSGILYALLHLQQLCLHGNITGSTVTIYCDGLSAVQAIHKSSSHDNNTHKHFDVINAINTVRNQLSIKITFAHVDGHQDQGTAYHRLDKLAQLNVIADQLATSKAFQMKYQDKLFQTTSLPYSHCDIFIQLENSQKTKVSTNLISSLQTIITQDDLRQYWIRKKNLENTSHQIDWGLRQKSLANLTTGEQRWWCKLRSWLYAR